MLKRSGSAAEKERERERERKEEKKGKTLIILKKTRRNEEQWKN
jgi:hypothetical protein